MQLTGAVARRALVRLFQNEDRAYDSSIATAVSFLFRVCISAAIFLSASSFRPPGFASNGSQPGVSGASLYP